MILSFLLSDLGYLAQSGRRGKITWGEISANPLDLIHPRFMLEAKLGNPTRMNLEDVKGYWEFWVSKETEGDPFSFLSGKEGEEADVEGKDKEIPHPTNKSLIMSPSPSTPEADIDSGIPLPCECDTPAMRTTCLQQLVPKSGSAGKSFHALVDLVDALKVSSVSIISFLLHLISF
jgi:hypothetical protein